MKKYIAIILAIIVGAFALTACDTGASSKSTKATTKAIRATQNEGVDAFTNQRNAVPYPEVQLRNSLERANLRERLLRFNKPNKIGYVYLMSFGRVIGYYVIKGKISSTESQMTNATWITKWVCPGNCSDTVGAVDAAGDDGSFGPNEHMVFFFTAGGAMIQVPEESAYYSDQPWSLNGIPQLVK